MRPSGILAVGLCMTLFLGLFVFSAPSETSRADPMCGVDYTSHARAHAYDILEVETTGQQSAPTDPIYTREIPSYPERGHFVASNDVGTAGFPGFHFYSPVVNTADFDVNTSHFIFDGADNISVYISFTYLNTLGTGDLVGRRPTNVTFSHFIGNESSEWTSSADTYAAVRYRDLWAGGIDLRYVAVAGMPNGYKSDFILTSASADPLDIEVAVAGANSLELSGDKQTLYIITDLGNITQELYIYNMATEEEVSGNFTVSGSVFGFEVDPEASWSKLVIDPLLYSTFLGGSSNDGALDVVVDQTTGEAYVVGFAASSAFPTVPGSYNTTHAGSTDLFIVKISADGDSLVYGTFVGGTGSDADSASYIAVDSQGRALVTCGQKSVDWPTTVGAFDEEDDAPDQDNIAVLRLSADGSDLEWSGVASGNDWDKIYAIALHPLTEDVYISGFTESADFPVTPGCYDATRSGDYDGFVARIGADGSDWNATYIGGASGDIIASIAFNSTGALYFGGITEADGFPTAGGAYDTSYNGANDLVYGIMSDDLSALNVSGYVGSAANDGGGYIAVLDDRVAVVGHSDATWPTTVGAYDTTHNGGNDIVVIILNQALDTRLYSTIYGGDSKDEPGGSASVAFDDNSNGGLLICGLTESLDLPTLHWSGSNETSGGRDAFVVKLRYDLSDIDYASYFGSTGWDYGKGVALLDTDDAWARDIYVVGMARDSGFPSSSGAFDETHNGGDDAFVLRLYHIFPQPLVANVTYPAGIELGENLTVYAKVTCTDNVSRAELHHSGVNYTMSNASLQYYNFTADIPLPTSGTNTFAIWALGWPGNTTETAPYTFEVGDVPQFSAIRASATVATVTAWQSSLTVTDAKVGDTGVASVWIRFDDDSDDWRQMTAEGDVYTSPVYVFNDEGEEFWQIRAYDNAGNVAYRTKTKLTVGGEASIASTSSTLTVEVTEEPWVPTEVSSWSWWVYVAVFSCLVLAFALTGAPNVPNGELLMSLLVAVGAGGMLAAYLSAVPSVFAAETIALVWLGLLAWAWACSRAGLAGLAGGSIVLMGYLAVQLWLAEAAFSWLLGSYAFGFAAGVTGAVSAKTANTYTIVATLILAPIAAVFGVLFVFA